MSVYLRAAQLLRMTQPREFEYSERSGFCCDCLREAGATDGEFEAFALVYRPKKGHWYSAWWADPSHNGDDQQARVLALLFMHWMTR